MSILPEVLLFVSFLCLQTFLLLFMIVHYKICINLASICLLKRKGRGETEERQAHVLISGTEGMLNTKVNKLYSDQIIYKKQ